MTDTSGVETVLFESPLLRIGRWRCPVDHPAFACSGPTTEAIFVFPRESVWIEHEHQRPFVADANTVTYYNRGQHYTRQPLSARGDRCEWFALRPDVLVDSLSDHDPSAVERADAPFWMTHGPADPWSYLRQRHVFEHVCHETQPDALFVEESIVRVFSRVTGLAYARARQPRATRRRSSAHRDPVEAARSIIASRFCERWSLTDLAREVGTSVFHLSRLFHERTGSTLHDYRTELRLRAALERIASPGTDLLGIALEVGFASHSHFTETFRRRFHQTPSEFRKGLERR